MNDDARATPLSRLLKMATKVEPNEIRATVLSFLFVFSIMAAYFILRPVRDALSSDWTDEQLSWLWTSTFFFSAIAVSIYGAVISHIRLKVIVPAVYVFFSLTLVGFYVAGNALGENDLLNRAYYVWASVLGLFHLSVFWTFMSGLYNKEQARRLFSIIALGATAGAIAGPAFVKTFVEQVGNLNMLLVSAALMLVPLPLIVQLDRLRESALGNADAHSEMIGKDKLTVNPFSGFTRFFSNPYLLWIGLFILLYVMMNTFLYYEIRKAVGDLSREQRAEVWASIDLAVNLLAAVTALFATGRLTTAFRHACNAGYRPCHHGDRLGDRYAEPDDADHRHRPGHSPGRELLNHQAGSGDAVHPGRRRNTIQVQAGDRYGRLSRWRCSDGLVLYNDRQGLRPRHGGRRRRWSSIRIDLDGSGRDARPPLRADREIGRGKPGETRG